MTSELFLIIISFIVSFVAIFSGITIGLKEPILFAYMTLPTLAALAMIIISLVNLRFYIENK